MARTKSTPRHPPNPRHESLRDTSSAPISTDWTSAQLKFHKPKRQRDLEEAFRILGAGLYNPGAVDARQLAWAKELARKEQELEDAENETVSAGSEGDVFEDQDEDENNDVEEEKDEDEDAGFLTGSKTPSGSRRSTPLTATNLASFDSQNEDAISATSSLSTVSNVSALEPEANVAGPTTAPSSAHSDQASRAIEPELTISPLEARLRNALDTLQYGDDPPNRPYLLTGLSKPLPHLDLTDLENLEVENRFWNDEIGRLNKFRRDLPADPLLATSAADKKSRSRKRDAKGKGKANSNDQGGSEQYDGEWHYESFGRTEPVIKIHRKRRTTVFARGIWEFKTSPDREVVYRILDEWPLTEEGEMLGWGAVSGEENQVVDVELVGDGREGGFGVWEVDEESVVDELEAESGEDGQGGMVGDGEDGEENVVENGGDHDIWEDMEE